MHLCRAFVFLSSFSPLVLPLSSLFFGWAPKASHRGRVFSHKPHSCSLVRRIWAASPSLIRGSWLALAVSHTGASTCLSRS